MTTFGLGVSASVVGITRTQRPLTTATCRPASAPPSLWALCSVSTEPMGSESLASTSTIPAFCPRTVTWSGTATGAASLLGGRMSTRILPGANFAAPNLAL